MSETSDKIRKEWAVNDAKRDAGLTTPEDVERFDDISYGPEKKWNMLDVYRPKEKKGCLPVIVNVHGGGWVYGDKELYQFYGMSLAQRGFAVVNFSYRLAPEHKYPAPLEDMNQVIIWMYENQEKYGLDMEHVFMVGDSAGANLLALYCGICVNPEYAQNYSFSVPKAFCPKAIALNCGSYVPISEAKETEEDENHELMDDFLPEKGSVRERYLINALRHVNAKFPPAFIMSCEGDFLKAQAPLMAEVLKENNVPYVLKIYGDKEKPLYHVFHVTIQEKVGQKCNDEECAFFKEYLA